MKYETNDALFDAEAQGRLGEVYVGRCRECGRRGCDGSCASIPMTEEEIELVELAMEEMSATPVR
jgi:hypothetical protein